VHKHAYLNAHPNFAGLTNMNTATHALASSKKGRLSLSIDKSLLARLDPYKDRINLSAKTEAFIAQLLEQLENQTWVTRNAEALEEHGKDIAQTGLAGAEFERI